MPRWCLRCILAKKGRVCVTPGTSSPRVLNRFRRSWSLCVANRNAHNRPRAEFLISFPKNFYDILNMRKFNFHQKNIDKLHLAPYSSHAAPCSSHEFCSHWSQTLINKLWAPAGPCPACFIFFTNFSPLFHSNFDLHALQRGVAAPHSAATNSIL